MSASKSLEPSDATSLTTPLDVPRLQKEIREWAIGHGWCNPEKPRSWYELSALIVTEIAEAIEAVRHGNPPCARPGMEHFTHLDEELADTAIRYIQAMDELRLTIGEPIEAIFYPFPVIIEELGNLCETLFSVEYRHFLTHLMLLSEQFNVPLAEAIDAKMAFNKTRPYRHGKLA